MRRLLGFILLFVVLLVGLIFGIIGNFDFSIYFKNKYYIIILLLLIALYIILEVITIANDMVLEHKEEEKRLIKLHERIQKCDPTLDQFELVDTVFEIYKKIKESFYNYDLKEIKKYVTDKVYKEYCNEFKKLESKKQTYKNEDIKLECGKLLDISKYHNFIKVRVYMLISSKGTLINSETKEPIKDASSNNSNSYMFTFVKVIDECPYCANDTTNDEYTCSKCGKILVKKDHNWIMSKKENIDKRKLG